MGRQYVADRCEFLSVQATVFDDVSFIPPGQRAGMLVVCGHGTAVVRAVAQILLHQFAIASDETATQSWQIRAFDKLWKLRQRSKGRLPLR